MKKKYIVYGSLENFFTFTSYKGFDPEVSGMAYPSMKQAVQLNTLLIFLVLVFH